MRLHFQETPWDLYIVLVYTVAVAPGILVLLGGNFGAILLVLFTPGYVLVATLFPTNKEIDWVPRLSLSLGLGLAIVALLGLILNFTPFGIRLIPIAMALAIFTFVLALTALFRRLRLSTADRLSFTVNLSIPDWRTHTVLNRALAIALAVSILSATGVLVFVIQTADRADRFTEFYIMGPDGDPTKYPTHLNISETGTVQLTVVNHEYTNVTYALRIDFVGVSRAYNSTTGSNVTVEVNRTTWSWMNFTLGNERFWTNPFSFRIDTIGLWEFEFLLLKLTDAFRLYTELHIFVNVVTT